MNAFIHTYSYTILIYTKLQQLVEGTAESVDTGTDCVDAIVFV